MPRPKTVTTPPPKAPTQSKKRSPRQQRLPGTAGPVYEEIDSLAEEYIALRDERMVLLDREVEAQAALVAAMERHRLDKYRSDNHDLLVEVTASKHAKVKRVKERVNAGGAGG